MVTRDGRRLEKEREDRPRKIWCWRSRESCKLCNFSLLYKPHVEEGKALSLPAQSLRQAVPQPWWGPLSVSSVLMRDREIPYSAPVLPRGKTNAFWTLQIRESWRLLPTELSQKTELPESEKILSFPVEYFMSTDQSHWCRLNHHANTDLKLGRRISITPLPALQLTWK